MGTKKFGTTLTMELPNVDVQRVGMAGGDTYVHTQSVAATLWEIQHNLNKYPSCTVVDSAGTVVVGEIEYVSKQLIRLRFTAPFSGRAFLN